MLTFRFLWFRIQSSALTAKLLSSSVDPDVHDLDLVIRLGEIHVSLENGLVQGGIWTLVVTHDKESKKLVITGMRQRERERYTWIYVIHLFVG